MWKKAQEHRGRGVPPGSGAERVPERVPARQRLPAGEGRSRPSPFPGPALRRPQLSAMKEPKHLRFQYTSPGAPDRHGGLGGPGRV